MLIYRLGLKWPLCIYFLRSQQKGLRGSGHGMPKPVSGSEWGNDGQ